jgi:hypothetical protein
MSSTDGPEQVKEWDSGSSGFRPPMVEEETGCGSTIVKPLGAFTDTRVKM